MPGRPSPPRHPTQLGWGGESGGSWVGPTARSPHPGPPGPGKDIQESGRENTLAERAEYFCAGHTQKTCPLARSLSRPGGGQRTHDLPVAAKPGLRAICGGWTAAPGSRQVQKEHLRERRAPTRACTPRPGQGQCPQPNTHLEASQ